jgi:hypothetical protein
MGVIGVAGVGVAGSWAESADGVAPALRFAADPFFVVRCYQCQHFHKKTPFNAIVNYLSFSLLALILLL